MQNSFLEIAAATLAAIFTPQSSDVQAEWFVEALELPAVVTQVRQEPEGVYARAGDWYALSPCDLAPICAEASRPATLEVPQDGIPGGFVATANQGEGIRRAWYSSPTDRYRHGALGDVIEGGALVAEDVYGKLYVVTLDASEVFEDLTPRIADIDGDGRNEIITIRTSVRSGAAVAVYGLSGRQLIEKASTPPIGRSNRWLNIAGIADFTGNGQLDIAIVKTPHIGGRLEILAWNRNRLEIVDSAEGFSNHAFGSTDQGLSAVARVDGDRIPDLVLPDARRRSLRMITVARGRIREIISLPLPARVETTIGVVSDDTPPIFATGLGDGSLVWITAK